MRGLNKLLMETKGWKDYSDLESDEDIQKTNKDLMHIAGLTLQYLGYVIKESGGMRLLGKEFIGDVLKLQSISTHCSDSKTEAGLNLNQALFVHILYRLSQVVEGHSVPIPGGLLEETHKLLCGLCNLQGLETRETNNIASL